MPVDSADKRLSASGTGIPGLDVLPSPDGTIDAADRADLSGLYGGLATSPIPGPSGEYVLIVGTSSCSTNRVSGNDSARTILMDITTGVGVTYDFAETESS